MPRAVFWYKVFCLLFTAFNLVLLAISLWFVFRHETLANDIVSSQMILSVGLVCAPAALFVAVANIWLILSTKIKNPWSIHLGNICAGITTCVLIPLALPLLIAWFHGDVKSWYSDRS